MDHLFYNQDPLAIVKHMDSYFKQIPPDCSLFSRDGHEILVHKEVLYQTRFMRQMIRSLDTEHCDIKLLLPSLWRSELELVVKFLYNGEIYCPDQTVFGHLTQLFGFPSKNFAFNGIIVKNETQEPEVDLTADHEMNGVDEYTKDDLTDKVTNLERENRKLKKMLKKSYDTPKDPWKDSWKEEDLGELEEEQLNLPLDLDYDMDNGAQDDFETAADYLSVSVDEKETKLVDYDVLYKSEDSPTPKPIPRDPRDKNMKLVKNVVDHEKMYDNFNANDEKPHVCKTCGKCFKKKKIMLNHIRIVHEKKKKVRPVWKCTLCEATSEDQGIRKGFNVQKGTSLSRHMADVHNIWHQCTVCNEKFTSNLKLIKHLNSDHNMKKSYECSVCQAVFKERHTLKKHISVVHEKEKPHLCNECGKSFGCANNLKNHIQSVHENRLMFECTKCDEKFKTKYSLKLHISMVHEGIEPAWKCTYCDLELKSELTLKKHMAYLHEGKVKKRHNCTTCGMTFGQKVTLIKHMETVHEGKEYKCTLCTQVFKSEYILQNHIDFDHEGKQMYECAVCNTLFKNKSSLDRHMLNIHEKDSLPERLCPHCGKSFIRVEHMNKHIRSVHEGVTYDCTVCSKQFKGKKALKTHFERVHEGKKTEVQCAICPSILTDHGSLQRHIMLVHEKKKTHSCNICNAQFGQRGNLKVHIKTVHEGERPYGCQLCDKTFTSKQILDGHIKRIHEGKEPMPQHQTVQHSAVNLTNLSSPY